MSDTFDHEGDAWESLIDGSYGATHSSRPLQCNRCGSRDVRWRQQTGRWVLFSNTPGVEHQCNGPASADEFEVVP